MLLTIEQANKLNFLENDETGEAAFIYDKNCAASVENLKYAIEMHKKYSYVFGYPFIKNIKELEEKLKEIEG